MKLSKVILAASLFIGSSALAETTELTISGMHCAGCKTMMKKNVCEDPELSAVLEKCDVQMVNEKKHIGKLTLTPKADQKLDMAKVEKAVKSNGEDYKITKTTTKKETK